MVKKNALQFAQTRGYHYLYSKLWHVCICHLELTSSRVTHTVWLNTQIPGADVIHLAAHTNNIHWLIEHHLFVCVCETAQCCLATFLAELPGHTITSNTVLLSTQTHGADVIGCIHKQYSSTPKGPRPFLQQNMAGCGLLNAIVEWSNSSLSSNHPRATSTCNCHNNNMDRI